MSDFMDKVKNFVDKGMDVSKDFLTKAGGKMQDLGEKGVIKVEIMQLERQLEKVYAKIGEMAANTFAENSKAVLSSTDESITSFLQQIEKLKDEIAKKEEAAEACSDK